MEIKNAKITNVSLTCSDHSVLTFYLTLEGGGWGVNVGSYVLGKNQCNYIEGSGKGMVALIKIMNVVGVEKWEDLKGKYVRIVDEGWGSTVTKIGNILEDKWFDLREFFSENEDDYIGRWALDERPPKEHEGKKEVWIVNWLIDVPKDTETIFENRESMYIAIEEIIQNCFPAPSDAYDDYIASKKCYKDKDFFNCSICLAKKGYI